jgi:hypothetical protein
MNDKINNGLNTNSSKEQIPYFIEISLDNPEPLEREARH